jgi:hypothetical protein
VSPVTHFLPTIKRNDLGRLAEAALLASWFPELPSVPVAEDCGEVVEFVRPAGDETVRPLTVVQRLHVDERLIGQPTRGVDYREPPRTRHRPGTRRGTRAGRPAPWLAADAGQAGRRIPLTVDGPVILLKIDIKGPQGLLKRRAKTPDRTPGVSNPACASLPSMTPGPGASRFPRGARPAVGHAGLSRA